MMKKSHFKSIGPWALVGPPLGPPLGLGPFPGPWWGPAGIGLSPGPWWGPAGIGPWWGPYKYVKIHIFKF